MFLTPSAVTLDCLPNLLRASSRCSLLSFLALHTHTRAAHTLPPSAPQTHEEEKQAGVNPECRHHAEGGGREREINPEKNTRQSGSHHRYHL